MAMGRLVVPQDRLSIALGNPSKVDPRPTPSAMARKIHKVRYRSRNDRRSRLGCAVILIPRSTGDTPAGGIDHLRSEEHTSELQSLMRISSAVSCLKKKITTKT